MKWIVRLAEARDAEAIWRLNRDVFSYDYPLESTKAHVTAILSGATNRLWVACLPEGRVVGYANACNYENTYSGSMKDLMAIAVEQGLQGGGAGSALLRAVEDWARADGCEAVRLVSGLNRESAHGFYQHQGYTLRKVQKNFIKML